MKSYFKCGLCDHTQTANDGYLGWEADLSHMISHYKWDHADDIGTKKYYPGSIDWYYDYRPIPDAIGPSFIDGDSGQSYDWTEVRKYAT